MITVKYMIYTKVGGIDSIRQVIVVAKPRHNYLTYDVTDLSDEHIEQLKICIEEGDKQRDNAMKDFELLTGIKQSSLWRSFKPEGIKWESENEIQITK